MAPVDPVEGMLCAQAVALHHAALDALRRALLPGQPAEVADKLLRHAANLMRAMADMLAALDRRRGRVVQQVVRIERVSVAAGAQAIVGAVAAPATGGRDEAGPEGGGAGG